MLHRGEHLAGLRKALLSGAWRQSLDYLLEHILFASDTLPHVNPKLKEKRLLVVFNPLDVPVAKKLHVNPYYTGLSDTARIREQGGTAKRLKLARDHSGKCLLATFVSRRETKAANRSKLQSARRDEKGVFIRCGPIPSKTAGNPLNKRNSLL